MFSYGTGPFTYDHVDAAAFAQDRRCPLLSGGGGCLSHAAVAVPQDAGMHATQTGADREADASSLVLGKSVSACVPAHMHTIFPLPLPSHSELPSFPRCP